MNLIYQLVSELEEKYIEMLSSFSNESIHDYRVLVRKIHILFGFLREEYDNEVFKRYYSFHKNNFDILSNVRDLKTGVEILKDRYDFTPNEIVMNEINNKIQLGIKRVRSKEPDTYILDDLMQLDINEHDLVNYLYVRLNVYYDRLKSYYSVSEKTLSDYHSERKTLKKIRYIFDHINFISNVEMVDLSSYKKIQDVYGLLNDLDSIRYNFINSKMLPVGLLDRDIKKISVDIDKIDLLKIVCKDIKTIKVRKNSYYKNYNQNISKISVVTGKAVVLDDMNRVLFLRRSKRYKGVEGLWELPGGRIDYKEKIDLGVKREVVEECGLTIKSLEVGMLWELFREGKPDILGVTYICRKKDGDIQLSEEHNNYKWVELNDIESVDMIEELREDFFKKGLIGQLMRYII